MINDRYLTAFTFAGFGTYNVLVNPNNDIVRTVLRTMLAAGDYFFFAIDSDAHVTAFRATIGLADLAGLKSHAPLIETAHTTEAQYAAALAAFACSPIPPGEPLAWVCREQRACLDPAADPLDMASSSPQAAAPVVPEGGAESPASEGARVRELRSLTEELEGLCGATGTEEVTPLALLGKMAPAMPLFQRVMALASPTELTALSQEFPGFHRFALLLEDLARSIASDKSDGLR